MNKKLIFFVAALISQFLILLYFSLYSIKIKAEAEKNGTVVVLPCVANDPFDPFKGRYLRLWVTEENPYCGNSADYYLQENLADKADKIHWKDFEKLKPELELYVNSKGKYVQKSLTVLENPEDENSRILIEEYLKK